MAQKIDCTMGIGSGILDDQALSAPLAFVNLGREEDYPVGVDLESRAALVLRGVISFNEKVTRAIEAGALGVIIVNNAPGLVRPFIQENGTVSVPVLLCRARSGSDTEGADRSGCCGAGPDPYGPRPKLLSHGWHFYVFPSYSGSGRFDESGKSGSKSF